MRLLAEYHADIMLGKKFGSGFAFFQSNHKSLAVKVKAAKALLQEFQSMPGEEQSQVVAVALASRDWSQPSEADITAAQQEGRLKVITLRIKQLKESMNNQGPSNQPGNVARTH